MKFHTRRQIGKSHVIDIFTGEDMENISLCIFQYLTPYYIIIIITLLVLFQAFFPIDGFSDLALGEGAQNLRGDGAPPNKLQQESGGTVGNGAKPPGNCEIFGFL